MQQHSKSQNIVNFRSKVATSHKILKVALKQQALKVVLHSKLFFLLYGTITIQKCWKRGLKTFTITELKTNIGYNCIAQHARYSDSSSVPLFRPAFTSKQEVNVFLKIKEDHAFLVQRKKDVILRKMLYIKQCDSALQVV